MYVCICMYVCMYVCIYVHVIKYKVILPLLLYYGNRLTA